MGKICRVCGSSKDEIEFDWSRPGKGHRPGYKIRKKICKACCAQQHREWRAKHIAAWLEFLESEEIEIKCQHCGYGSKSLYAALDWHHLDPDSKEGLISQSIQKWSIESDRVPDLLRTIKEDCILLCANCHRLVHTNQITLEGK